MPVLVLLPVAVVGVDLVVLWVDAVATARLAGVDSLVAPLLLMAVVDLALGPLLSCLSLT